METSATSFGMCTGRGASVVVRRACFLLGSFFLFFLLSHFSTACFNRDSIFGLPNAGPLILTWNIASSISFCRRLLQRFFTILRALAPLSGHAVLTGRVIAASAMRGSSPKRGWYSDFDFIRWLRNHWVLVVLLVPVLIPMGMWGLMFSLMLNFIWFHSTSNLLLPVFCVEQE